MLTALCEISVQLVLIHKFLWQYDCTFQVVLKKFDSLQIFLILRFDGLWHSMHGLTELDGFISSYA